MYYTELGNVQFNATNAGPFQNFQKFFYWSGTAYAPNPDRAWFFWITDGFQNNTDKSQAYYAVAVRPGDVAAIVPEPQTLALVLLALGAAMVTPRRRPMTTELQQIPV
jgi:hypothetical protein